MSGSFTIEKLRRDHDIETFDCGKGPLNRFLKRFALQSEQANASRTYLGLKDGLPVGYYTLVFGQVEFEDAPERLKRGVARHPVPVMILARLAVDLSQQGRGVGAGLLKDAMLRTSQAAGIAGLRAMLVHAKDEEAQRLYEHFGFLPSATDPMHLLMPLKDILAVIG